MRMNKIFLIASTTMVLIQGQLQAAKLTIEEDDYIPKPIFKGFLEYKSLYASAPLVLRYRLKPTIESEVLTEMQSIIRKENPRNLISHDDKAKSWKITIPDGTIWKAWIRGPKYMLDPKRTAIFLHCEDYGTRQVFIYEIQDDHPQYYLYMERLKETVLEQGKKKAEGLHIEQYFETEGQPVPEELVILGRH